MVRILILIFTFVLSSLGQGADSKASHSIVEKLPGPESIYTSRIIGLIRNWQPRPPGDVQYPEPLSGRIRLRCLRTPGQPDYIGLEQSFSVRSPLEKVEAVLDDFAHYAQLFSGFDSVRVLAQDGNRWIIGWEQHVPVFFIPNVKYDTYYLLDKSRTDRKIYRYQLVREGKIKKSDGLIVIENQPGLPGVTRYTEYDYFDADWGIVKTIAPERIWGDSVEGIYLSDMAIKLKAENPEWSYARIAQAASKTLPIRCED